MSVVALIKTLEGIFLLANNDYSVTGFESINDGLRSFTQGYDEAHTRGYERSMSACMNYIQFNPSICQFDSLEDLVESLFEGETEVKPCRISSVSGYYTVIRLPNQELAKENWERGEKPALISY